VESLSEDARNENACMWQALWLRYTLSRAYLHLPMKPMHPLYTLACRQTGYLRYIYIDGLRRGSYKLPHIVHCPANSNLCEYTYVCVCVCVWRICLYTRFVPRGINTHISPKRSCSGSSCCSISTSIVVVLVVDTYKV